MKTQLTSHACLLLFWLVDFNNMLYLRQAEVFRFQLL